MSKGQLLSPKLPKTRQPYKKFQAHSNGVKGQVDTERNQSTASARANVDWSRLAFEASSLGKWEYTLSTGVIRFDERAQRHYGMAHDTATVDTVFQQIHPDDRQRLAGEMAATLAPTSEGSYAGEYRVVHPDGTVHWVAVQAQVYFEGEGEARQPTLGFGTTQDITVRKAAEHAHQQYAQRLEILHAIDLGIMNAGSIAEIITTALQQIRVFFGCQQATALLFDFTAQEVLMYASHAVGSAVLQPGRRYPLTPGFLESVGSAQVTVIDDLQAQSTLHPFEQRLKNDGMRSSLRASFLQQGQPMGLLVLHATTPAYFSAEQRAIAAEIATQIAIAIQQQQLSTELARHIQTVEEVQQFLQATLDSFPAHTAVLDSQGTIITVNHPWKSFADAQGAQNPAYFVGTNYLTVCDGAVGAEADEAEAVAAGIRAVIAGVQDDFYLGYTCHYELRKQWFMLRVTPFNEPAPRRVVVAHIDITERRLAEIAEHEQRLLAETLRDSLAALTTSLDVETVLQQILAYSATVIPSEAGAIILFEGNQGHVVYTRGHSPAAEAFFKTNRLILDAGVYVSEENQPTYYLATDTRTTPNWVSFPATAWIRSSMGVRISVRGQPIGLLTADSAIPNRFQPKDVVHLQTFAHYAALALENAHHVNQLEQRVQRRTAELQAAKARLEAILNNSTDGIVLVNSDLSIQLTNTVFDTLFGVAPDAYYGQSLITFIHPEDSDRVSEFMGGVFAAEQGKPLELCAQRRDGTFFDAELSAGLIKGDGVVCTVRDITERKAQERQLRYHASLQENVSDAVIVTDMAFRIQSWNQAAERIYGWHSAEAFGKTSADLLQTRFVAPTDLAQSRQQLHEQGWWQGEVIQQCKDGTQRHLLGSVTVIKDAHGVPFSVVAVNHDITERKQAEQALQQSAAEIHDLYNHAPCGYHSLNADGMIIQINDTELHWLGYERAEVIQQRRFMDFMTPESKVSFAQSFPLFKVRGWVNDLEFDLVRKDGSLIQVLVNGTAIYDQDGQYLMSRSSVFDITELKRAQQALRASEQRYRLLAENISDVVMRSDENAVYLYVSPSSRAIMGYEPAELVGQSSLAFLHPDDYTTTYEQAVAAVQQKRTDLNQVLRFRHKQGHYIWMESNIRIVYAPQTGVLAGFIAVSRDISERQQAAAALQASEEKYRRLIDTMRGGLIMYDTDDRVSYINDRACELLGYQRAEVMGQRAYDYVDASAVELVKAQLAERRRLESSSYEVLARRKDGSPLYLLVSGSPLVDNQGRYNGCFIIAVDITVQKQAEATLRQALAKEKELGELKSRFVSMASHEFRTPLATILALTETLSAYRHKLPDEQIQQRLDRIKEQISHLKGIMEDVLLLSRMQARRVEFHPVELDLDALCRELIEEFASPSNKPRLHYRCCGAGYPVAVDQKLMRQIISNLLSNAVKYSPVDKPVQISLHFTAEAFIVQVRDEGIGIPEADLKHLFEPFHRATNVGTISGTGLGLVITKEAVELHGGTITVDSQVQQGTTCTIRIPSRQLEQNRDPSNGEP